MAGRVEGRGGLVSSGCGRLRGVSLALLRGSGCGLEQLFAGVPVLDLGAQAQEDLADRDLDDAAKAQLRSLEGLVLAASVSPSTTSAFVLLFLMVSYYERSLVESSPGYSSVHSLNSAGASAMWS